MQEVSRSHNVFTKQIKNNFIDPELYAMTSNWNLLNVFLTNQYATAGGSCEKLVTVFFLCKVNQK